MSIILKVIKFRNQITAAHLRKKKYLLKSKLIDKISVGYDKSILQYFQ